MIKAGAGGDNSFEGFAKILIEHHGSIHLRDNRILAPFGRGKGKEPGKFGPKGFGKDQGKLGSKGFGKGSSGKPTYTPQWRAYAAEEMGQYMEHYGEQSGSDQSTKIGDTLQSSGVK